MTIPTTAPSVTAITRLAGRVIVVGDLTSPFRHTLKEQVLDALSAGEREIVVDLHGSDYIDSSGCGVLVSCAKHCSTQGASFAIAGLNEDIRKLFALTKLDTLFILTEPRP